MDSIKIEVNGIDDVELKGNKVGHKAEPNIDNMFVGYANNSESNVTVLVPMSNLLRVTLTERKK